LFPVWDVKEMRQMFEQAPVPLPSTAGFVSLPHVDAVVMKALTESDDERYQSATDFEEALRTVIATSGAPVTATGLAREIAAIEAQPTPEIVTAPDVPQSVQPLVPEAPTTQERVPASESKPPSREGPPAAVSPSTQPMQSQPAPTTAVLGSQAAPFIISLAGETPSSRSPLEPLPKTSTVAQAPPKTTLLAQNDGLEWSREIGDDADLLAIAKAVAA